MSIFLLLTDLRYQTSLFFYVIAVDEHSFLKVYMYFIDFL